MTDPKLMAGPLSRPGEVIRVSRGDLGAQLKALGPRRKKPTGAARAEAPGAKAQVRKQAKPKPPPKRDKVDKAQAALREARRRHAVEAGELERQREAIDRRVEALRAKHAKELARLERKRDEVRTAYRAALEEWSG